MHINFRTIAIFFSTLLFLLSTVILPRSVDMDSNIGTYVDILKIVSAIFNLSIFILFFKLRLKHLLIIFFISFLVLLTRHFTLMSIYLYILAVFVIGDKNKSFRFYIYIKFFLILLVVLISIITKSNFGNVFDSTRGTRYSFGFTNPNTFAMLCFDVILGLLYLKPKIINFFILLLLGIIIYYFTKSRTFIMMFSIFFLACFIKNNKIKKYKFIIVNSFLMFFMISFILILLKDTPLNSFLSRRPEMMYEYVRQNNFSLFGISTDSLKNNVDNSYIRILIQYGLVLFIICAIAINRTINNLYKSGDYLGIKIIVIILMFDIFEKQIFGQGSIIILFIANSLCIYKAYNNSKEEKVVQENISLLEVK